MELWRRAGNLAELWWSRHAGLPWELLASHRLHLLLRHARAHSPFYRAHFARVGADPELHALPPITKSALMAAFDGWCTDREVMRHKLEAFFADPDNIGHRFLGRYVAWKSSGTTGTPGLFVQDAASLAVYDALVAAQLEEEPYASACANLTSAAPRSALVVATNDHFASIASWTRMCSGLPAAAARAFPVLDPLPRLVAGLDAFRPDFIAAYPSVLSMLAAERHAGRLRATPSLLWSGGETLSRSARTRIEQAFGVPVINEYGASECLSIGSECAQGWMHVNAEWVILEGIDAQGQLVPPGVTSDRALLTNLANWVQPIIRYELDDRILARGSPCPCGDPRPAVKVEGRQGAVLRLADEGARAVPIAPLALETIVEGAVPDARFQVAQVAPASLVLRYEPGESHAPSAWKRARAALLDYLASQSLGNVRVRLDPGGPRLDPRSGKLHSVVFERRGR